MDSEQFIHLLLVDHKGIEISIHELQDLFPKAKKVSLDLWELVLCVVVHDAIEITELGEDYLQFLHKLTLLHFKYYTSFIQVPVNRGR